MADAAMKRGLPNRRRTLSTEIEHRGVGIVMGVGFDAAGTVREVFADGPKTGQDMEGLLDDGCILLSLLLQSGHGIADLAERLGRESIDPADPATGQRPPASAIGAVAREAAAIEFGAIESGGGS